MPFKIEDLMAPGMNGPIRTAEAQVQQPALKTETPVPTPKPRKVKQIKERKKVEKKELSPMVEKAKDILTVVLMATIGIAFIALVVRGIQFLFSI